MVVGGESCSEGCGSESQPTGWTFFTMICCKNCNVCFKKTQIMKNRPGMAHFLSNILNLIE